MSDSPNRSTTMGPTTVTPQLVTDPTILDSVAGFINEVVPSTHSSPQDTRDQIQWAHFEQLDCEEPPILSNNEYENLTPPAVILVLGYTTGIQVWAIPANGEATEILSWRHGSVKTLKFLPTPFVVGGKRDVFASKRPIVGICDSSSAGPLFSSVNFISLKTGEQVKVLKFKNSVLGMLANRRSVVVTFQEKIAVFDAFTLENLLTVTTCYLSPGLQPNPVALGSRWMAFAEKKLNSSKKSNGGNDGDGIQSYTATVLQAAKTLGKGLRELRESVASSWSGNTSFKPGTSPNSPQAGGMSDIPQKGIVTILDIESPCAYFQEKPPPACDPVVAHFTAHAEAIVYLKFDPSGMLLFTADKRGHDFHLYRIHSHPGGPALAAVHHLYILHRGDTSARVQDMCFSPDSRWASVSTLRGTTHVFPITPYGGHVGVRTHTTPHVVNKMSRFHRSAGLTIDGRSNSPVSMFELPSNSNFPYHNPRLPPYPHPTVVHPLAQIRQPVHTQNNGTNPQRIPTGRQAIPSSPLEETDFLRVVACFAHPRAWLDSPHKNVSLNKPLKPVESLLVMSCYGTLVQYDLDPHQVPSIPKERVSGDNPIELSVCAKAQWLLQRQLGTADLTAPMTADSLGFVTSSAPSGGHIKSDHNDDQWLSQVEISTHAAPHRRLWMGPQFTFKTYMTPSDSPMSLAEAQPIEPIDLGRTKPVNMPITKANAILIESSSASSCEQGLLETYHKHFAERGGVGELLKLKEDLADAMLESPGIRDNRGHCVIVQMKPAVTKVVNPLGTVVTVQSDDSPEVEPCEEVIHANCDESLFRPFVATKAVHCEKSKGYGDNIITKSLDNTTEVAVRILEKSSDKIKSKPREVSPGSDKVKIIKMPAKDKIKEPLTKAKIEVKSELEPVFDVPDFKPLRELDSDTKTSKFELPPLENDDFFSLDNQLKIDHFEDAREFEETLISLHNSDKLNNKPKSSTLEDSSETNTSEDNAFDEKIIPKRFRKPKAKLGIKIVNMDKEKEKTFDDCSSEITVPAKNSWSSIAASKPAKEKIFIDYAKSSWDNIVTTKPTREKTLTDYADEEKKHEFDLPKIEFMEEFTLNLPKKSRILSDLIDISSTRDEKATKDNTNKDLLGITEDTSFMRIDKSSDDEKGESSSPVDTTESDDSGKIPEISSGLEIWASSNTAVTVSKNSRRRKKKK